MTKFELPQTWPTSLRIITNPGQTFREVAQRGTGFGNLFGLLAIEFLLAHPLVITQQAMQLSIDPAVALLGLWSRYVRFALGVGIGLFLAGVVLYYVLRRYPERRLDLWAAASVLAYTWVPHVLLVAIGVILAQLGLDHPLLAQHPFSAVSGGGWSMAKAGLELSPSLLLGWVAIRTLWHTKVRPSQSWAKGKTGTWVQWAAVLLVVTGFGASGYRVARDWRTVRPLMPGDQLPAFSLPGLDGPSLKSSELAGEVALIDFWATWCPPCRKSMPHLEAFHKDFGERGFRLVSVNIEPDEPESVRHFIREQGLSFPVFVDEGTLQRQFQVTTFPTVILVDPHGVVRHVFIGEVSPNRLRTAIEVLLAERNAHGH